MLPENLEKSSALKSGVEIAEKCLDVGFAWTDLDQTIAAIYDEIDEVKAEFSKTPINFENVFEELGDVIFTVASLAAFVRKSHPEAKNFDLDEFAHKTLAKFSNRFTKMLQLMKSEGKDIERLAPGSMPYSEWKTFWDRIKAQIAAEKKALSLRDSAPCHS